MTANPLRVVLPGDIISEIPKNDKTTKISIGPGLKQITEDIIACKAGVLIQKKNMYWIDNHQKRYVPIRGEDVVGVVTNKGGDSLKVDIGSSEQASLSILAFEGATKKNRPDVQVGDVLFAKLVTARADMEPELVCVDSHGKKGRLGLLSTDGFLFSCSLNLVCKILNPICPLIDTLSKEIACEITVGMNGKVWIKAKSIKNTIAVINAILAAEYKSNNEIEDMCRDIFAVLGL